VYMLSQKAMVIYARLTNKMASVPIVERVGIQTFTTLAIRNIRSIR